MAKVAFHLYFAEELIKEPIMYEVARDHDLSLNIRRATITEEFGEALIEFEGSDEAIEEANKDLVARGVKVEPVLGDIVEG